MLVVIEKYVKVVIKKKKKKVIALSCTGKGIAKQSQTLSIYFLIFNKCLFGQIICAWYFL